MVVFSSPQAALREGFRVVELDRTVGLYIVERDWARADGRRVRALAFARVAEGDTASSGSD
ncbi:MAG: hypothetical protein EB084_25125 [Proteobacteria bacterium]|nr:hypothetical protein [Pseudomonadota bacterium]